jgi:hypothetical protein
MLQDVIVNLAAGLIILVLDVALVVWLLPKVLFRRIKERWKPARIAFAEKVDASHFFIISLLRECHMSFRWTTRAAGKTSKELRLKEIRDDIAFYTMAFDPEMTAMGVDYLHSAEEVAELIEGIVGVVQDDSSPNFMQENAARNIAELREKFLAQNGLVRKLCAYVGVPDPLVSSEHGESDLHRSIRSLERLGEELGAAHVSRPMMRVKAAPTWERSA